MPQNTTHCLRSYAAIRIKPLPEARLLEKGILETDEILVLIPLSKWDSTNGLFLDDIHISPGSYVCISGKKAVTFPGSGGAELIMLVLRFDRP